VYCVGLGEFPHLNDAVKELAAIAQLFDHVDCRFVLVHLLSEKDFPGPRNSGSGDSGYGFVDLGGQFGEQVKDGLRNGHSGISARAGHRRNGDLGLWVRNKEQCADRRVMTANTRVRWPRRVSRSSSIRRP
jgi:hypothetical protein